MVKNGKWIKNLFLCHVTIIIRLNQSIMTQNFFLRWQRHHEYIEKMNLQALLSASSQNTEYIGELLASQGKVIY